MYDDFTVPVLTDGAVVCQPTIVGLFFMRLFSLRGLFPRVFRQRQDSLHVYNNVYNFVFLNKIPLHLVQFEKRFNFVEILAL